MKENIIFGILVAIIAFICSATVLTSPEKVVDVDEEYVYTEKYSLFNKDTTMHKYSKPICYYAVCTNKNKFRTYNVAAKTSTLFKQVTILYKNKEYTLNDYYLYNNLEIGDTCLAIEYFYPYKEVKFKLCDK